MHPHPHTSAGTLHRVRGLHAWPFSVTLPCRQPHSIFGGLIFNETVSSEDGVRLPTWWGSLKIIAHTILSSYGLYLVHVRVWVHAGWRSERSAEERYNNNNNEKVIYWAWKLMRLEWDECIVWILFFIDDVWLWVSFIQYWLEDWKSS